MQDIRNILAGEKIKWVASDIMHLTLKFLGDTPEDTIRQIINMVDAPFRKIPVMTLHFSSVGLFKNLRNPRVIWIGIKPCPPLEQAVQILDNTLASFGYPADSCGIYATSDPGQGEGDQTDGKACPFTGEVQKWILWNGRCQGNNLL